VSPAQIERAIGLHFFANRLRDVRKALLVKINSGEMIELP
jgi:hypothetical protein